MKNIVIQLETLSCPTCAAKIEGALKKTAGVKNPSVLFNTSRVKLSYDEQVIGLEGVKGVISKLGYGSLSVRETP
ncbi:MAG: heavy-metal-associated domain-containing protein [Sphaerochaeta sp.]|nr:heavy-metal-associated domain-containing protein [Sphaerochaeta sp.]